jgi:hypothetical protein
MPFIFNEGMKILKWNKYESYPAKATHQIISFIPMCRWAHLVGSIRFTTTKRSDRNAWYYVFALLPTKNPDGI